MDMANSQFVYSNLGGMGGWWADATTPRGIRLANVGSTVGGKPIDLVVTNQSTYVPRNIYANGLKADGDFVPTFGVINLIGPAGGAPWTYVDLRFQFVNGLTDEPMVIPETFFTFYDLDTTPSGARECLQFEGGSAYFASNSTELVSYTPAEVNALIGGAAYDVGGGVTYCGSEIGGNLDNPTDPKDLTESQADRSVMVSLENTSSFSVRYAIIGCCTTGRNLLFGGYTGLEMPLCDAPPSAPPRPPSTPPAVPGST